MLITLLYENAPLHFRFCSNMLKIALSFRHCKSRHKKNTPERVRECYGTNNGSTELITEVVLEKPLADASF